MRLWSTAAEAEEASLIEAEKGREQNEFNLHSRSNWIACCLTNCQPKEMVLPQQMAAFIQSTIGSTFPRVFACRLGQFPSEIASPPFRSLILRIVMVFMGYFLNSSCLFHYCYFRFFLVFSRFEFSVVTNRREEEEGSKSSSRLEEGEDSPTKETGGRGQNANCPGQ